MKVSNVNKKEAKKKRKIKTASLRLLYQDTGSDFMIKAQTLSWDGGIPLDVIRTTLCRVNWHSSILPPWADPPQNCTVSRACFQCLSTSFFLAPHLSVTPSQGYSVFPAQCCPECCLLGGSFYCTPNPLTSLLIPMLCSKSTTAPVPLTTW